MERIRLWRESRPVRVVGSLLGSILVFAGIVSLPSILDDLARWAFLGPLVTGLFRDLAEFMSPLTGDVGRWMALILGLVLLLFFNARVGRRVTEPQLANSPDRDRGVRGSPRSVLVRADDVGMAGAYQNKGPQDDAGLWALVRDRTALPGTGTEPAPTTAPPQADQLGPVITTVDSRVLGIDEPPEGWGGQFWQGKQILKCPWDDYRTIDDTAFQAHRDRHTDPPTDTEAQRVSTMLWPWAKVPIHYLGDGSQYFGGVPADPEHTLYTTAARAQELIGTGLYGAGPVEGQKHSFSGAVGRGIVCTCGFEAATTPEFQSHLSETGSA